MVGGCSLQLEAQAAEVWQGGTCRPGFDKNKRDVSRFGCNGMLNMVIQLCF